jgi:serine/threonine-protein kinase RsbW
MRQTTPPPPPGKEASRSFPSRLESVQELLDWMEDIRFAEISEDIWVQAKTAIVEGFTNAVRHAHADQVPPPPVGVRIVRRPDALELEVIDSGAPFQMQAEAPQPDQERHWGLIMLQRLQERYGWRIDYVSTGTQGNILRIHHSLVQESPPGEALPGSP